jgi:hypothetical protein
MVVVVPVTVIAWVEHWSYSRASQKAEQAVQFQKLEADLNQFPFSGISTDVHGYKYSNGVQQDVVSQLDAIKLNETIAFSLTPVGTIADCAVTETTTIAVTLIAPAFTVTPIGNGAHPRKELIAPSCDLSSKDPPPVPAWRWNIVPTQAGHHLITLTLQALDKTGQELAFKPIDIPVTIVAPETSFSTEIGTIGAIIGVITGLFGLWGQLGKRPAEPSRRA